jgi:DNA-directed RNA polymerase specialized sigma24 family protein
VRSLHFLPLLGNGIDRSGTGTHRGSPGQAGAFRELTDPYRRELQLHCYRIVGSVQAAEDMLLGTLLAAWLGAWRS